MTFGAAAPVRIPPVDRLALLREHCVDCKWPFWRVDPLYQAFESVQATEVRRVLVQVVDAEQMPPILLRAIDGKHPVYLAQIAGQTENVVAVIGKTRPLRLVLNRRVPQEGVADRGVRALDVLCNDMRRRRPDIEPRQ